MISDDELFIALENKQFCRAKIRASSSRGKVKKIRDQYQEVVRARYVSKISKLFIINKSKSYLANIKLFPVTRSKKGIKICFGKKSAASLVDQGNFELEPMLEVIEGAGNLKSNLAVVGTMLSSPKVSLILVYSLSKEKNSISLVYKTTLYTRILPSFGCFGDQIVFLNGKGNICRLSISCLGFE